MSSLPVVTFAPAMFSPSVRPVTVSADRSRCASMRESSYTDCALSVTGPKLSTAIVTGPMPRKPKAMRPKAKIGPANEYASGMIAATSAFFEIHQPSAIRPAMTRPFQNAEKLPATKPERMLSDAPPCLEALTTSST